MEGSGRVPWLENSPVSEVWLHLLQSSDTPWPLWTPHQKVPVNSTWHTPHWAVITETACHNLHKSPCISTQTKKEREGTLVVRETPVNVNNVVCFGCELWEWAIQAALTKLEAGSKNCASFTRGILGLDSTKNPSIFSQSRTRIWYTIVPSLPSSHTHTQSIIPQRPLP